MRAGPQTTVGGRREREGIRLCHADDGLRRGGVPAVGEAAAVPGEHGDTAKTVKTLPAGGTREAEAGECARGRGREAGEGGEGGPVQERGRKLGGYSKW